MDGPLRNLKVTPVLLSNVNVKKEGNEFVNSLLSVRRLHEFKPVDSELASLNYWVSQNT